MAQLLRIGSFYLPTLLLQSCMTGSVLRTAHVLEKKQLEVSAGIVKNQLEDFAEAIIVAYGVSDHFEIEGRLEDRYIALTPRLQLLESKRHWVDCLAFFEIGYSPYTRMLGGPGIMIGKRFHDFSPYIAYKYRHYQHNWIVWHDYRDTHYIKLGVRYNLPPFWKKSPSSQTDWFVGLEGGPTIFPHEDTIFEWAANIGFNF